VMQEFLELNTIL
jgi:hypothetical protein